jgi:hypothetical protein
MRLTLAKIFAPHNRGILLDLVVFLVNVLLMRVATILSLNLVHQAEENTLAKLSIGFFFAGLLFLQPLGPTLKRWSFHQRTHFNSSSSAGCFLFWFMFVYLAAMLMISGAGAILINESLFEKGSTGADIGGLALLAGFVWSIVSVVVIYRYFRPPKKKPRWKFLTTSGAERLGDVSMFLNVICLQILWGSLTASTTFREATISTPLGRAGSFTDILGRLIVISALAALVYFPARIFYLVEDKHRRITWLTMLVANLPLILGIVFASPVHSTPTRSAGPPPPLMRRVFGESSFIISAEDLYKEYELESQAGAKQYSGKYVVVSGSVKAVDMKEGDPLGSHVRLVGGVGFRFVYCRFDDDQKETMKTLKEKQRVTLQGVGERFWIGGPLLNHCVLVNTQ